jgi:hypothetical protein
MRTTFPTKHSLWVNLLLQYCSTAIVKSASQFAPFGFGTLPQQSIPSAKLRVALLGDKQFEYDKTQVPELPTIHLLKDIDQLWEEWESLNLLHVGSHGIMEFL